MLGTTYSHAELQREQSRLEDARRLQDAVLHEVIAWLSAQGRVDGAPFAVPACTGRPRRPVLACCIPLASRWSRVQRLLLVEELGVCDAFRVGGLSPQLLARSCTRLERLRIHADAVIAAAMRGVERAAEHGPAVIDAARRQSQAAPFMTLQPTELP